MLSATELGAMRAAAQAALTDTATVMRKALTPDGKGGQTASWTPAETAACRLSPSQRMASEREEAAQVKALSQWVITLPCGVDVRVEDRLTIGGRTFEVNSVHARTWELCRRVEATEVR